MSIETFKKIYNNLPEKEKETTIVIIRDEKITWKRALTEMENETPLGKEIEKKLIELGVL